MRFEELAVGQSATFSKTVTEADVVQFAGITGDLNPLHIDAVAAAGSRFGGRIAHGMLSAGLISAVIGMKLPGSGTIYLEQSLRFRAPVRIGDTVTARVEIVELIAKRRRVRLRTICEVEGGEVVIEGEALVMVEES